MSNKYRGIKRYRVRLFYSFCHAALILIFAMGFWLGSASSDHAAGAVLFDGNDDFLFAEFDPSLEFEQLTLMLWVRRGISSTDAESSYARAVNQPPPQNGFIKTSYSIFTLQPDKFDPKRFGFKLSNSAGDWEIWAGSDYYMTDPDRWYHIAVTYDSTLDSTLPPDEERRDNLFLYLDGQVAAFGRAEGAIVDFRSIWFGRLVHAIGGAEGDIVAYSSALTLQQINEIMDCGPVAVDNRVFYWPLDEGSGNAVTDPISDLILYLGNEGPDPKYEPVWTEADYHLDTDGDTFPDSCDNCPGIENNQADQDGDGVGNECDDCSMDPLGSGGECDFVVESVADEVTELIPTIGFQWGTDSKDAPDAFMVPQNCKNTKFVCFDAVTGQQIKSHCSHPGSFELTVHQYMEGGVPVAGVGGDLTLYVNKHSTTIQCSLLDPFKIEDFANGAVCYAVYIAATFDRDLVWNADGSTTCLREPCAVPNNDFPYGYAFVGTATSNWFTIDPVKVATVNLRHSSYPNNVKDDGGDGIVTLGIYSDSDFDARTVDHESVSIKGLPSKGATCPPVSVEIRDLDETLPNPDGTHDNPDEASDMLLHFRESCIGVALGDQEVEVWGKTTDGTQFTARDVVTVR